jgi:hypothetical protein
VFKYKQTAEGATTRCQNRRSCLPVTVAQRMQKLQLHLGEVSTHDWSISHLEGARSRKQHRHPSPDSVFARPKVLACRKSRSELLGLEASATRHGEMFGLGMPSKRSVLSLLGLHSFNIRASTLSNGHFVVSNIPTVLFGLVHE